MAPDRRAWRRTATLIAHMASMTVGGKWNADQFDPYYVPPSPYERAKEMAAFARQFTKAMGGVDTHIDDTVTV